MLLLNLLLVFTCLSSLLQVADAGGTFYVSLKRVCFFAFNYVLALRFYCEQRVEGFPLLGVSFTRYIFQKSCFLIV